MKLLVGVVLGIFGVIFGLAGIRGGNIGLGALGALLIGAAIVLSLYEFLREVLHIPGGSGKMHGPEKPKTLEQRYADRAKSGETPNN